MKMKNNGKTTTYLIVNCIFQATILIALWMIGMRNMEYVENTRLICEKLGVSHEIHTNWFGNATKIYVKR